MIGVCIICSAGRLALSSVSDIMVEIESLYYTDPI